MSLNKRINVSYTVIWTGFKFIGLTLIILVTIPFRLTVSAPAAGEGRRVPKVVERGPPRRMAAGFLASQRLKGKPEKVIPIVLSLQLAPQEMATALQLRRLNS